MSYGRAFSFSLTLKFFSEVSVREVQLHSMNGAQFFIRSLCYEEKIMIFFGIDGKMWTSAKYRHPCVALGSASTRMVHTPAYAIWATNSATEPVKVSASLTT